MPQVKIEFEVKPDKRVAPKGDKRTQVREGDTVTFGLPHGATNGRISFSGRTPFGQNDLPLDKPQTVLRAFDAGPNEEKNVYRYNCSLELNGEKLAGSWGGEMEIIRT